MDQLELYIHIPFCARKCNYCDFLSGPFDQGIRVAYTDALIRELKFLGERVRDKEIISVYIGGGTPSWLETDLMDQILTVVNQYFQIKPDAEFTIECNPGTVTAQALNLYRAHHINRISLGLQSANDDELKELGRIHDYNRFLHTYELVRNAGFTNVSVDIMTGLPHQTMDKLKNTLNTVVRLKPEHISSYALIIEEGTPFYDKYKFDAVKQHAGMETEDLPSEDLEYALSKYATDFLEEHGYHRYEISNYARLGFEGKHNSGYWRRIPYLGAGLGASSFADHFRLKNETDIYRYIENWKTNDPDMSRLYIESNELSRQDEMAEFFFLGLRMTEGVYLTDFENNFGCSWDAIYGDAIKQMKEEKLMVQEAGRLYLTDRGLDVSNYVFSYFI